ncbi:MAG: InlB B-repeat-containing protein [Candidatus Methanomethylophilaceae archaeon]
MDSKKTRFSFSDLKKTNNLKRNIMIVVPIAILLVLTAFIIFGNSSLLDNNVSETDTEAYTDVGTSSAFYSAILTDKRISVSSDICLDDPATIPYDAILRIPAEYTLTLNGEITNDGTITDYGTIVINDTGTLTNNGTLDVYSSLILSAQSHLNGSYDGKLSKTDTAVITDDSAFVSLTVTRNSSTVVFGYDDSSYGITSWVQVFTVNLTDGDVIVSTIYASEGESITLNDLASNDDRLFSCWMLNGIDLGSRYVVNASDANGDGVITIVTCWLYKLQFSSALGTAPYSMWVLSGGVVSLKSMSFGNAIFEGWSINGLDVGAQYVVKSSDATRGKITLTASWSYLVSFSDGHDINSTHAAAEDSIILPTVAVPSGYAFDGWYTESAGGVLIGLAGQYYTVSAPPSGDTVTLYAHFTVLPVYSVSFYDGNTLIGTSYACNGGYVGIETADKTGYAFDGWYTDPDLSDSSYVGKTGNYGPVSSDADLYAKYTQETSSHTVTYTPVTGGSASGTTRAAEGGTILITVQPAAGKILSSISISGTDSYCKTEDNVYMAIMGDKDVTVTPVFTDAPTYFTLDLEFNTDHSVDVIVGGSGTPSDVTVTYYRTVADDGKIVIGTYTRTYIITDTGTYTFTDLEDNTYSMIGTLRYTVDGVNYYLTSNQVVYTS